MSNRMTAEQVKFYEEQGYLLYDQPVYPEKKFAGLKDHFEGLLEKWTAEGKAPESMDTPHFADPKLFEWLLADEVLDIVEPLIGPDIALFSSHFICKPPSVGKRVPWHEDSAYWKGRLEPMDVVTIWLAVDPSVVANGCMRVIPGTHDNGFSAYEDVKDPSKEVFSTEIRQDLVDESKAVDCILEANHCSLHHGKVIHGSNPNTGTMRRCGYTMRFMPSSVKFIPNERVPHFQIYLARGKDKAGNQYGDPTKVNEAFVQAMSA